MKSDEVDRGWMSETPKWMPSAHDFFDVLLMYGVDGKVDLEPLRSLLRAAVEKALAEVKATGCRNGHLPVYHHADVSCPACTERERGEGALAEQKQEWVAALKTASGEYKCHPDFAEMWAQAESDPTYWAALLVSYKSSYRARALELALEAAEQAIRDVAEFTTEETWATESFRRWKERPAVYWARSHGGQKKPDRDFQRNHR